MPLFIRENEDAAILHKMRSENSLGCSPFGIIKIKIFASDDVFARKRVPDRDSPIHVSLSSSYGRTWPADNTSSSFCSCGG